MDDVIPIATYVYNISLTANGLESPYYLVFGRDPLEGRLTHIQGYCRYVREQPERQMVYELQKHCMTSEQKRIQKKVMTTPSMTRPLT